MHITLNNSRVLVDEVPVVSVVGLNDDDDVIISAEVDDRDRRTWIAYGRYQSVCGEVDTTVQASLGGTYEGVDPMGLLWSAIPVTPEQKAEFERRLQAERRMLPQLFTTEQYAGSRPLLVRLRASARGEVAETSYERFFCNPSVEEREVAEGRIRGKTFAPVGAESASAVVVISGSSGGIAEQQARLLASRGHLVFALAYCGYDDLPTSPLDIDIEYFNEGIGWFRSQVSAPTLTLVATSYGTQAATIVGAEYPGLIDALVLLVPSHVLNMGLASDFSVAGSFLRKNGRPIPYVAPEFPILKQIEAAQRTETITDIALSDYYRSVWKEVEAKAASRLPIERVNLPTLLVSGTDDQLWPSDFAARCLKERANGPIDHISINGGGHLAIGTPGHTAWNSHLGGWNPLAPQYVHNPLGGSPSANGRGQFTTWRAVDEFLRRNCDAEVELPPL